MTATETPVERPVEFVQSLPEARRRDIFFALLREFYAANGDLAAIPLREGDTDLGYLVRPDGVLTGYQKLMMSLPREVAEHLSVARFTLTVCRPCGRGLTARRSRTA